MQRVFVLALTVSVCGAALTGPASAQPIQMAPNAYGAQAQAMPVQRLPAIWAAALSNSCSAAAQQPRALWRHASTPPVMQPHVLRQPDMQMGPPPAPMYVRNDPAHMVGPGYAGSPRSPRSIRAT